MARAIAALLTCQTASAITLTTRGRVAGMTAVDLHRFLATPANWPDVVASSVGVEGPTTQKPLTRGASVDELFGLPPILPQSHYGNPTPPGWYPAPVVPGPAAAPAPASSAVPEARPPRR